MKKALCTLFLSVHLVTLLGQTPMNLDSLLNLLQNARPDTNSVELYINIGQQYETSQPEIAKEYYLKAGSLSKSLSYPLGFCQFAANYTAVLNMQGKYDSSLVVNFEALKVAEDWGDKMWITKMNFNIGNCYNYKLEYETALNYYLKVVPYFEEIENKPYQALIYDVMQVLYQNLREYPKAVYYGEKALALFPDPESNERGVALLNLSISYLYSTPSQQEKAMYGFQEVMRIAQANENEYLESSALMNMADFYYRNNNMQKARPYYEQSLSLSKKIDDVQGVCIAMRGLSYFELYNNNFTESEKIIRNVLGLAAENQLLNEMKEAYSSLAELALARHSYNEYRAYLQKKDSLSNIILNAEILKVTQDVEAKYETEKKQNQILTLEKDKKIQYIFIAGLMLMLVLIVVVSVIFSRSLTRKRQLIEKDAELKAQRINELEKEKQLAAAQALLQGEEAERNRLARDLHDGLGGLLSGVKINISNMKENVYLSDSQVNSFNDAISLLDSSIKELRRIANNMAPETLHNYGLKTALHDYCIGVTPAGSAGIVFNSYGKEFRLNHETELALYRVVQELINNAVKHSGASSINLQIFFEERRIAIQVFDNGCGFDTKGTEKHSDGHGLNNVKNRISAIGGKFEIYSKPDEGTEILVELEF